MSLRCEYTFIAIGNPGAGKSTLLNGFIGEIRFASGVSFGEGLTTVLQEETVVKDNGNTVVRYIDTPGLADDKLRQLAAKAIQQGLSRGGKFKLCFVVQQNNGRIVDQDVTTIRLVLDACGDQVKDQYGILVNQIHPKMLSKMRDNDGLGIKKFQASIRHCLPKGCETVHFHYLEHLDGLQAADNAVWDVPEHVRTFIQCLPSVNIVPENVKQINDQSFAAVNTALENKIAEFLRQKKLQDEEIERLREDTVRRQQEMTGLKAEFQQKFADAAATRSGQLAQLKKTQEVEFQRATSQAGPQEEIMKKLQETYKVRLAEIENQYAAEVQKILEEAEHNPYYEWLLGGLGVVTGTGMTVGGVATGLAAAEAIVGGMAGAGLVAAGGGVLLAGGGVVVVLMGLSALNLSDAL